MKITSDAFQDGEMIPEKYSCDGENVSPPLSWSQVPKDAKSLALICDDPDAPMGTWTHWVLYNIPPDAMGLEENIHLFPGNTVMGVNSWPKAEYGGPCPPSGTHRYIFKLYALDAELNLTSEVTSRLLQQAMEGHILDRAQLVGRYRRRDG